MVLAWHLIRTHSFQIDVTWGSFKDHVYVPLAVTMGAGVLGDTLMASILAYYLHSKRTQGSAQLITRLMGYVVGTGAFTSMFAAIELIAITASPNSLLYVAFAVIQVKIYANSALLSLNLRQYQRKPRQDVALPLYDSNTTPDNSKTSLAPIF
ncbi:hypothetical protein J3A83DRAFT_438076 [Scleroderma citrinum]